MKTRNSIKRSVNEISESEPASKVKRNKSGNKRNTACCSNSDALKIKSDSFFDKTCHSKATEDIDKFGNLSNVERLSSDSDDSFSFANNAKIKDKNLSHASKSRTTVSNILDDNESPYFERLASKSYEMERLSKSSKNDEAPNNSRLTVNDKKLQEASKNKSQRCLRNSSKCVSYRETDEDDDEDFHQTVKDKQPSTKKTKSQSSKKVKDKRHGHNTKKTKSQSSEKVISPYFSTKMEINGCKSEKACHSKIVNNSKDAKCIIDGEQMSSESDDDWVEIPGNVATTSTTAESELLFMSELNEKITNQPGSSKKSNSIEITLLDPELAKQCKTKSLDEIVKQKARKVQRDTQEYLHKSHLLALIGHGMHLNNICSSNILKGLALSSMTTEFISRFRPVTLDKVKLLLNWFKSQYSHYDEQTEESFFKLMKESLSCRRGNKTIIMLLLVVFMRTLSIEARIILACFPLPLKLTQSIPSLKPKQTTTSIKKCKKSLDTESDDDFDIKEVEADDCRLPNNVLKKNYKMLSDNEEPNSPQFQSLAYWIEFYLPKEKRWVCFEYFSSILDNYKQVSEIMKSSIKRLNYVFAFNENGSIKDISAKYDQGRYTTTRKFRVPSDWLNNALQLYAVKNDIQNRLEEEEIRRILMDLPFPEKVDDFNNHPLYALTRHLKKYEVMYPPNPTNVGFIKSEPIYLRDNVHLCHTRETWLKSARVIKMGEEPVKTVKAQMSMKRKLLGDKDPVVQLFGYWQTEPYQPPVAKGGIVPKNEHGNVDLYQECMLPIGCVYLQLPGLLRIAKKLNIDVAPAMVGWKFHARFARPILDGWVVCKEHALVLQDAWSAEQDAKDKKRDEEKTNRALKNWRRLTRFLLIRDRIRSSYDLKSSARESAISSVARAMAQKLSGKSGTSVLPQDN